jgi:hypothetical protein
MASRFETYVNERVAELAKAKRDRLKAALEEEEARVEAQREKYLALVEDGVEKLVASVVAQARKDGCKVAKDLSEAEGQLSEYAKGKVRSVIGLQKEYDYDRHTNLWPKGTVARRLQDALMAFDAFCGKESRRIVVYKMDLNMKPDAFEAMLAEVAEKIKEA